MGADRALSIISVMLACGQAFSILVVVIPGVFTEESLNDAGFSSFEISIGDGGRTLLGVWPGVVVFGLGMIVLAAWIKPAVVHRSLRWILIATMSIASLLTIMPLYTWGQFSWVKLGHGPFPVLSMWLCALLAINVPLFFQWLVLKVANRHVMNR